MELKERLLLLDGETADGTPAPRHRPGRGSALSDAERDDIRLAYLCERLTITKIAKRFGRDRETVSQVLAHPDTKTVEAEVRTWRREKAKQTLAGSVDDAARHWTAAMAIASKRGDHRGARDLLLSEGVASLPKDSGGSVVIQIGVVSPLDVKIGGESVDARAPRAIEGGQALSRRDRIG